MPLRHPCMVSDVLRMLSHLPQEKRAAGKACVHTGHSTLSLLSSMTSLSKADCLHAQQEPQQGLKGGWGTGIPMTAQAPCSIRRPQPRSSRQRLLQLLVLCQCRPDVHAAGAPHAMPPVLSKRSPWSSGRDSETFTRHVRVHSSGCMAAEDEGEGITLTGRRSKDSASHESQKARGQSLATTRDYLF